MEVPALPRAPVDGPIELWAFLAGVKPVVFLTVEPGREAATRARLGDVHVERRERRVEIAAGDRWRDDRGAGAPRVELYASRDPALARRAARLQAEGDPSRDLVELGALMGYPRCCVDAFARQDHRGDNSRNRHLAAARTTAPGPWPWQLNELHVRVIPFFPCAYTCAAAVAFADATLAALDAEVPGARAGLAAYLARTVLYLDHDRQLWIGPTAIHRVGDDPALVVLAAAVVAGEVPPFDGFVAPFR